MEGGKEGEVVCWGSGQECPVLGKPCLLPAV